MNTIFPKEENQISIKNLNTKEELTNNLFKTMIQTQIYHWLTDSKNIHEVLGDFYTELQNKLDVLAERYLSYKYDLNGEYSIDISYEYSKSKLNACLNNCRNNLTDYIKQEDNPSIQDVYISILTLVDKTIYLLQFT